MWIYSTETLLLAQKKKKLTCISSCCTTCIWTLHWAVLLSSRACSLFRCLKGQRDIYIVISHWYIKKDCTDVWMFTAYLGIALYSAFIHQPLNSDKKEKCPHSMFLPPPCFTVIIYSRWHVLLVFHHTLFAVISYSFRDVVLLPNLAFIIRFVH